MDPARMQSFKDRLTSRRDRLEQEIRQVEDARVEGLRPPGEVSDDPTHNADRDAEELGRELAVEATLRDELRAVHAAMDRIQEGNYGECERCGAEISEERLQAIPQATFCVDCERQEEQETV